ncbi:TniB family NTP-binding protein [Shewanella psychrotolerans]|uniref:TniB family NTP-binding protein n=1 Tax=Shewanella psychrotolerans TaxID=2864206 RepID=UPI001C6590FB|nr:TniB family NTP-binding protein [Shewanella psychrotolerans]QYK03117.1 TniB family NTP-binding protein [Shewanella psychrotolerans]
MPFKRPKLSEKTQRFSNLTLKLPTFLRVQKALSRLHKYAGVQPRILLITSPSHCGKTTALKHYMNTVNESASEENNHEFTYAPIIYVQAFGKSGLNGLLVSILKELGVRNAKETNRASDLLSSVVEKLKAYKIDIVIIDEVQHIVPVSGQTKTQGIADVIKTITNETNTCVALSGLPDAKKILRPSAEEYRKQNNYQHVDDSQQMQLTNRALKSVHLKPFFYDIDPDSDWMNIVIGYEKVLQSLEVPLIDFEKQDLPLRLWLATGGIIGRLKYLFQEAIEEFESGDHNRSKLDLKILAEAYEITAEYTEVDDTPDFNPFTATDKQLALQLSIAQYGE